MYSIDESIDKVDFVLDPTFNFLTRESYSIELSMSEMRQNDIHMRQKTF